MKRIRAGKLVFEREVLRRLSSTELGGVHGAGITAVCKSRQCNGVTVGCQYSEPVTCYPTVGCLTDEMTCTCPTQGCQNQSAHGC